MVHPPHSEATLSRAPGAIPDTSGYVRIRFNTLPNCVWTTRAPSEGNKISKTPFFFATVGHDGSRSHACPWQSPDAGRLESVWTGTQEKPADRVTCPKDNRCAADMSLRVAAGGPWRHQTLLQPPLALAVTSKQHEGGRFGLRFDQSMA